MRREFSKQVKRDALRRADKKCENPKCGALFGVKFHFDHDIADGLGGEPTLENCVVLCLPCHKEKTTKHDVPLIAKVKRISDKHQGIKGPKEDSEPPIPAICTTAHRYAPAQLVSR